MPHGTFGSVLHALSLGLFGAQGMRTDEQVVTDYKVKPREPERTTVSTDASKKIQLAFGPNEEILNREKEREDGYQIIRRRTSGEDSAYE